MAKNTMAVTVPIAVLTATVEQLQFIIDECKTNLAFGDYLDPYEGVDSVTSDDTKRLEMIVSLLHQCVTKKESM
jgi:hypothetical protein